MYPGVKMQFGRSVTTTPASSSRPSASFMSRRHTAFGKATSSIFGNPADEQPVSIWGRVTRLMRSVGRHHNTSLGFFAQQVSKIGRLCLSQDMELGHAHRQRVEALKRLEVLDRDITDNQLYQQDERVIIWSALVCVFHFQQQLRGTGCLECNRVSYYERAVFVYDRLLKRTVQDKPVQVINAIMTCITTGKYWQLEHVCVCVLSRILIYSVPCEMLLNAVLDHLEGEIRKIEVEESRHVVRVLYAVLETYLWPAMTSSAINAVLRLLELYRTSTLLSERQAQNYSKIKKGLEVCATRIFDNMSNVDLLYVVSSMAEWTTDPDISDEALLDISSMLEYASSKHNTELLADTLNRELFMTLLGMVSSDRRLVSLLGNRVFHYLLDRNDNRLQFDTPKIFFQDTHFNVVVGEYYSEDKNFLRQYREQIHDAFLRAFMLHGHNRLNLDAAYTTICLMVTEVPCGYTAASVVCLIMNIQSEALTNGNIDQHPEQYPYHLHATVMSVMSLLCWVHRADEFYEYVNQVMNRRANQAPHLNPPLRKIYSFAAHHVRWNKPDLFFEDWEVRYGLWKCFRTGEPQQGSTNENDDFA